MHFITDNSIRFLKTTFNISQNILETDKYSWYTDKCSYDI